MPMPTRSVFCRSMGSSIKTPDGRLQTMARFRSRLIRIYWEIDNDRMYDLLGETVGDIEQFLAEHIRALQRE